jgi:hypothetical protein
MYGVDDRRFKQKVGKSQESHIFYKVLVFEVFYILRRGGPLLPYGNNLSIGHNYCPCKSIILFLLLLCFHIRLVVFFHILLEVILWVRWSTIQWMMILIHFI